MIINVFILKVKSLHLATNQKEYGNKKSHQNNTRYRNLHH